MVINEVEVCSLANKFTDMVAQEAWKVWAKLPQHTKSWVSFEDIMQDGMIKLVTEVLPKFNGNHRSLSSFIYFSLRNHFDECYSCKFAGAWSYSGRRRYKRRDERSVVGIEDLAVSDPERRNCWDVLHSLSENLLYSESQRSCWVVPILIQIHSEASDGLKKEMIHWFLTNERLRLDTPKFHSTCHEFRVLAEKNLLDVEDCRHLFASPVCMEELYTGLHVVPANA